MTKSTKLNEDIVLYNIDCVDYLSNIEDKKFNLTITDPPYNVGRKYNEYDDNKSQLDYEKWCDKWFDELIRTSETVVMTIGYKNLKYWMNKNPKHMIIWHKPNQNSSSPLGGFNTYEPILFWGKTHKRIGHDLIKTNISMQEEAKWHDCPKHLPSWIKIIDMIIDTETKANIFDPFSGSGTTAIACHRLKHNFVGCEIDSDYYEKSCQRIKNHVSQLTLF